VFAQFQANNRKAMYMKDWEKKLGEFLKLNDRDILENVGKVTHDVAVALAEKEFEKYSTEQDRKLVSDFDEYVARLDNQKRKPKK
jgi:hypothetical protein